MPCCLARLTRVFELAADTEGKKCTAAASTFIWSPPFINKEMKFSIKVDVPKGYGTTGAAVVKAVGRIPNGHSKSIYLDRVQIADPLHKDVTTVVWCHSWVGQGDAERLFFHNQVIL